MEQEHRQSPGRPPHMRLQVSLRHRAGESRLTCRGEIDRATAPILRDALELAMTTRPPVVLLDWRLVSFVALAGADVLLEAAGHCRSTGSVLQLIPGRAGRRVLDILGWDDIEEARDPFELPEEVEEALLSVLPRGNGHPPPSET